MAVGLITMDMYVPSSSWRLNGWRRDRAERQTRKMAQANPPASVMVRDQGGAILLNDTCDDAAVSRR